MAATSVVQPIDLIKTRMQLAGEMGAKANKGTMSTMLNVVKTEGARNLYKGLTAALLRQATYTTARLGFYDMISTSLIDMNKGKALPFYQKLFAGMSAGGLGALVGTPAEVALIRMTADGRLPVEQRRNYKNVVDALFRIVREEGITALWKGCVPTIMRAMILNAAQLASYTQAKQVLLQSGYFPDGVMTHFGASLISGFLATAVSLPVDMAKTRIQNQKTAQYKNTIDVLIKVGSNEGVFALWKGFAPYFLRLGPHTIITFMVLEQLNKTFK